VNPRIWVAAILGFALPQLAQAADLETLIWAELRPPSTLHPFHANSGTDLRAQAPIHPPLARPHGSQWRHPLFRDVQWQPGRVQLQVEPGSRFHDGVRVDGAHICQTIAALKRSRSVLGARISPKIRGCIRDPKQPRVVTIELSVVEDGPQWDALAFPLLPTHLDGDLAAPDHPIAEQPIGTGPWSASPHPLGIHYTAQGDDPALELRVIPEAETIPRLLRTGAIHGWPDVPGGWVDDLRTMPEVRLHAYPMRLLLGLAVNTNTLSQPQQRAALQPSGEGLCQRASTPPPDAPPTCRPATGPFHLEHPGRNQAVHPPPKGATPTHIRVLVPTDLDWRASVLTDALEKEWSTSQVEIESMSTSQWLALPTEEVRRRWDIVVVQRFADDRDLGPWLGPNGRLNPFRFCPPDVQSVLRDGSDRELHATHADAMTHLWWVQRDGISAWSSRFSSIWMTPVDGLGALVDWDLSQTVPDFVP